MKRVDVQRLRIRVKGPAAGWSGEAAARLGASILSRLAAQRELYGSGRDGAARVLPRVDTGTVRSAGGGPAAPGLAGRIAEAVAAASRAQADG